MKYEAVFGNQELFDGAGTFTGSDVVVHSIASGIKSYARLSNLTPESLRNHPVCAMRRIIAEPKRWTREDKKAGLLPDVGSIAIGKRTKLEYEVVVVTEKQIIVKCTDGMCTMYGHDVFIAFFEPVETPTEKAQREEDEFVSEHDESLLGVVCMDSSHRKCYELGKRAAYRKLKGGE